MIITITVPKLRLIKNKLVRKAIYYILSLIWILSLAGCKVKRPKSVLSEDKMENILYDYHIAKAMGDNLPYTENYKKVLYLEYVFNKYGTTEEAFDSSMVWYTRHTEILSKIYDNVSERLKQDQNSIEDLVAIRDNRPKTSQPGDSVDVWLWERLYHLTGHPLNNKIRFTLSTDTNFHNRDTLVWQVQYTFLGFEPDSADAPYMAMQVVYDNDSVMSDVQRVFSSGAHQLRLQADTLGAMKEVKGFVYYAQGDSLNRLLLDQIALMRYHSNDSLSVLKTDSVADTKKEAEVKEEHAKPVEQPEDKSNAAVEPRRVDRPRPVTSREVKVEEEEVVQTRN